MGLFWWGGVIRFAKTGISASAATSAALAGFGSTCWYAAQELTDRRAGTDAAAVPIGTELGAVVPFHSTKL